MSELTYEDFKQRIDIQELLLDAGYHLNKRDGLRYPSYVRLDSENHRIRGDKFIVTGNGLCCFRPPERKNYNVISFIKEHPEMFSEYLPGMSKDRLVNLVCHRLLNQPIDDKEAKIMSPQQKNVKFDLNNYQLIRFDLQDWDSQKKFYGYFKNRGITLETQRAFADHLLLAITTRENGNTYTHLAFPMNVPDKEEIVGLEERSRPNLEGKSAYKGKAAGSNSSEGLWIANLSDKQLKNAKDVYWFESGYDAMAYYQLHPNKDELNDAVFLSTGGTPGEKQFAGIIDILPNANHHLCFDRDRAGLLYAVNFALQREGRVFSNYLTDKGNLVIRDLTEGYERKSIPTDGMDFKEICRSVDIDELRNILHLPIDGYKDWNDQLLGRKNIETSHTTNEIKEEREKEKALSNQTEETENEQHTAHRRR